MIICYLPPMKGTSGNSIDNSRAKVHLGCLMRFSCATACHGGWCGTTTDATIWSTTDAARTARTTSALDAKLLNSKWWVEFEFERTEFSHWKKVNGFIMGCYCWWFRNPKQPPGIYKTLINNGIIYHSNWCRISSINRIMSWIHGV